MEAHVKRRCGSFDERRRWCVGVSSARGAGRVVFGNDLIDCGRQVNKQIIFEVAGRASKVGVVGLRKLGNAVDGG